MFVPASIVVHCFGRHAGTNGVERIIWGDPAQDVMGALPTLAMVVIKNLDLVAGLSFGTGASRTADGVIECRWLRDTLLDRLHRLNTFSPLAQLLSVDPYRLGYLRGLLESARLDDTSQNTAQEIRQLTEHAVDNGGLDVVGVTSGSHAARCANLVAEERQSGLVPADLVWSIVPDGTTFGGRTAVFEYPHRGDDPVLGWASQPSDVFAGFFAIPPELRKEALQQIAGTIGRYQRA